MKIKPATAEDVFLVQRAVAKLKEARDFLRWAKCPKGAAAVRRALKSAEGAQRHVQHRRNRSLSAPR